MKHTLSVFFLSLSLAGAQSVPSEKVPASPDAGKDRKAAAEPAQPSAFDEEIPRLIQCQLECVELSHEDMTKLLFLRNQSLANATNLRKELQDMVAQNKAKVVDTMIVVAKSGQKATSESIMEYTYATEYEPSEVPNSIGVPEKEITPLDIKVFDWMRTPPTPTSFEPRNCGGNLEVEPSLSPDNKLIDLRFNWEIVDHEGEKAWLEYKDSSDNTYKIEMPKFYVKRVSTSITCVPASYTLVATVDPQNEKGVRDTSRKWLIFAKCEVQVVR